MNIAAVVDNLGPSQKSFYLIKEFNRASGDRRLCTSVFFQRSAIPVVPTLFSCKSISFLSGYHHVSVATSLNEANILLQGNNASKKFLYLWDLEWLRTPGHYDVVSNLLLDERLHLIARSDSHATMIENFCNKKPVGIVDNWKLEQLLGAIQNV